MNVKAIERKIAYLGKEGGKDQYMYVMQLSRNASFSSGVLHGVSLSLMSSSWVSAVLSLYCALTR